VLREEAVEGIKISFRFRKLFDETYVAIVKHPIVVIEFAFQVTLVTVVLQRLM
jgi:hypothetical protein